MTVFYNNNDYLDAAAANRLRLSGQTPQIPIVRNGRDWVEYVREGVKDVREEPRAKKGVSFYKKSLENWDTSKGISNLSSLMEEYNLSPLDVALFMQLSLKTINAYLSGLLDFSPTKERRLRRYICMEFPMVYKKENADTGMLFNVFYHARELVSNASAKDVVHYFNNTPSSKIQMIKKSDIWAFVYRHSSMSDECVFAKSDDLETLIASFVKGAMRGLCSGYRIEIA